MGILEPDPETKELVLTHIHPGIKLEDVKANTGWDLKVSSNLKTTAPPNEIELKALRDLNFRTTTKHGSIAGD